MADDFVDLYEDDDSAAGLAVFNALPLAPERAAQARKYAEALNLPPETVDRNYAEVERRAKTEAARAALAAAPVTKAWIADPDNAAVAHDEIENLTGIEAAVGRMKSVGKFLGGSALSGLYGASAGVVGAYQALQEIQLPLPETVAGRQLRLNNERMVSGFRRDIEATAERFRPKTGNDTLDAVGQGVASFFQSAPNLLLSVMTGNPAPMLAGAGVTTGGQAYGKARDTGLSPVRSAGFAGGQAGFEVLTEAIPASRLIADVGKSSLARTFFNQIVAELPGEQVATLTQDLNEWVTLNPEKSLGEYLRARPEAAWATAVATVTGVGLNTSVSLAANRAATSMDRRAARAQAGKAQAEGLAQTVEAVRASPLLERAPERLEALLREATEGEQVFVPGEQVATYLQSLDPQEAALFVEATGIGPQLGAELPAGADIVFDAAEYLARVAPTPAHDAWAKDVRIGMDGESLSSAEAFEADKAELMAAEGVRLAQLATEAEAQAAPARRVYEAVFSQLREAGYTIDASRAQAALWQARYETRAARRPDLYADAEAAMAASAPKIERVLPERLQTAIRAGDKLSRMVGDLRRSAEGKQDQGPSLLNWLSAQGGVNDPAGDLAAMDAGEWHKGKPGKRKLLSPDGRALDDLAVAAWEAGYFPDLEESPTDADLREAIREELAGAPRHAKPRDQRKDRYAAELGELEQILHELGVDPTTATPEQVRDALGRFMAERGVEGVTLEQPVEPLADFVTRVRDTYGLRDFAVTQLRDGSLHLDHIATPAGEQGAGRGSAAMRELVDYADAIGARVLLTPESRHDGQGKTSRGRLVSFYKRFGFVENKGRRRDFSTQAGMIREPQVRTLDQAATDPGSAAFLAWFGDSKVVDEQGEPLVVYHGTAASFDEFSKAADAKHIELPGFYFTPDPAWAERFSASASRKEFRDAAGYIEGYEGANIVPAYLSIQNPARIDASREGGAMAGHKEIRAELEAARKAGHDGAVITGWTDGSGPTQWVAFAPTQIKSVFNRGTFDPADPRILYQGAKPTLEELFAEVRAKRAERDAIAERLSANDRPVRLFGKGERAALVSPDLEREGRWRVTRLDQDGPIGHSEFASKREAMDVALSEGYLPPDDTLTLFQPAYHGSPHLFDSFSLDAIGTGEGAQAYGWGLYFAGRKEIAEYYRKALASKALTEEEYNNPDIRAALAVDAAGGEDLAEARLLDTYANFAPGSAAHERAKAALASIRSGAYKNAPLPKGRLYHVEIPEDGEYLLWDRSLSQQPPKVREALRALGIDVDNAEVRAYDDALLAALRDDGPTELPKQPRDPSGEDIYRQLTRANASDRAASLALREAGVAGIKYLDGGSRAAGEGHFNYVVFDDSRVSIRTYEQAGDALFHGSSRDDLGELKPSERGALGPGVYLTPNKNVAARYGDAIYQVLEPEGVFNGLGSRDSRVNPYQVWRDQVARLVAVAGEHAAEVQAIADRMQPADGYPFYRRLEALLGSTEAAQGLFKAAGFTGLSGHVDGPEVVLFDAATAERLAANQYEQPARGSITFTHAQSLIRLFEGRDLSTLIHEGGHLWLEELVADASDPDAPQQLRDDLATVRAWMGLEDGQAIGVEQHEQWARAVEAYMREGRAPSASLRAAFQRFTAWLTRIYRRASDLNVNVSPAMRNVFDRLIATDEEIAAASAEQHLAPLIESAEQLGMTEAEFAAYAKAFTHAEDAARAKLLAEVMAPIRRRTLASWKAERERVMQEMLEQVDAQPDMRALAAIAAGAPLDRAVVASILGSDSQLATLPKRVPPIYSDAGAHPDVLAETLGFSSGEEMLESLIDYEAERQAMRAAGDKRTVRIARAEALAEAEMRERHGDPMTDGSIEEEAVAALNEKLRLDAMGSEVRLLARRLGQQDDRWSRAGLAEWADRTIRQRPVYGIRPALYLRAERDAGKAAFEAMAANDLEAALQARYRQLANAHLYRAAKAATERLSEAESLFRRVITAKETASKSRDWNLVNAARAVLEVYGFERAANTPFEYLELVKAYDPDTYAALMPQVMAAIAPPPGANLRVTDWDNLTFDQADALAALIDSIWKLSRRNRTAVIEGRRVELEAISGELMADLAAKKTPKGEPTDRDFTPLEDATAKLLGAKAALTKVEWWAERMGPAFSRYVWRPIQQAADAYRADRDRYIPRLLDALKPLEADLAKPRKIEAPELGYTFKNLAEVIGAMRHAGNESNLRKLLLGRGWGEELPDGSLNATRWRGFIDRMHREGVIQQRHWDYVQAEWDLHEEIKPLAQRAHQALYGRYFAEITANPVQTPWGEYPGGYVAAKTDPRRDAAAELRVDEEALVGGNAGSFRFPTPANGFTKGRVEFNAPLDLDLRQAVSQMNEVLKFAHMGPAVKDVNRILTDKETAAALRAYQPAAYRDMLHPWLLRAASMRVTTPTQGKAGQLIDAVVNTIAQRTGMMIMMGSLVNTAQQITGLPAAALLTGKRNMGTALGDFLRNPRAMMASVAAASPLMADRQRKQTLALEEAMDELVLSPNLYQRAVKWTTQHAYFMQHGFQNVLDPIVWTAAHSRAVERGEADPAGFADSVVRRTQGSLNPEDLTRWASGPTWAKPFKMFSNYFLDQANMLESEWVKAGSAGRKAEVYALGFLVPAVLAELIGQALRGQLEGDDDDWWWDELMEIGLISQLKLALAMVPGVGQFGALALAQTDDKAFNDKLSLSPIAGGLEATARLPKDIAKLINGEGDASQTLKDLAAAISLGTGLPAQPLAKPAIYAADVAEGDVTPLNPADAARAALTGSPSEASRN